jgi:hypothetical protein
MEKGQCPRFGLIVRNDRSDIKEYERLEDHIKMAPRKYAMRIWHMLGTHSHDSCSIRGEIFLHVVKIDILFLPPNNLCLEISMSDSVSLGEKLRFWDILTMTLLLLTDFINPYLLFVLK